MNVPEAIGLFKNEMMNEIFHSSADDELQDSLIEAVKRAEEIVKATYQAERKGK